MPMPYPSHIDPVAATGKPGGRRHPVGGGHSLDSGFVVWDQTDRLNRIHMTTNSSRKVFGCIRAGYRYDDDSARPVGPSGHRLNGL